MGHHWILFHHLQYHMDIAASSLGVLIFVVLNAYADKFKIREGIKIHHWLEGGIQLLVLIAISFISDRWILQSIFNLCLFWLTFDYFLNRIRKLDWWHLGSAMMDQILKGYVLRYYRLGLKIVLVIASLILFVYI